MNLHPSPAAGNSRRRSCPGGSSQGRRCGESGILLLEIMLAVAIFSVAVIGLGRCVSNCLAAEAIRTQDARARQLLASRSAEIQASLALPDASATNEMEAPFAGFTVVESRRAANLHNEKDATLAGLFEITLRAEWTAAGARQSRTVNFYLLRQGF
jgi:Tfp pilus assembly protein PilV